MFSTILAVVAVSAAAGMRIALPLLIIGLVHNPGYWADVPLLNYFPPQVVLAILISWSLFELFASKRLLGQRILQLLQLVLKLVQVGWFFRLRGIPAGIALTEDILSVLLVLYALNSPEQGGLIAMMLLWLALRSSSSWKKWHKNHAGP